MMYSRKLMAVAVLGVDAVRMNHAPRHRLPSQDGHVPRHDSLLPNAKGDKPQSPSAVPDLFSSIETSTFASSRSSPASSVSSSDTVLLSALEQADSDRFPSEVTDPDSLASLAKKKNKTKSSQSHTILKEQTTPPQKDNIFTVTYNMEGKIEQIDDIARQLVAMSGNQPVKVFAFQETFELAKGVGGCFWQLGIWLWSVAWGRWWGRAWKIEQALLTQLNAQQEGVEYVYVNHTFMWSFHTVVFVEKKFRNNVKVEALDRCAKGLNGYVGNKGAVAMNIEIGSSSGNYSWFRKFKPTTSVLVLNVHLPSKNGPEADQKRLEMYHDIKAKYASFYEDAAGNKKNVIILGDFNARSSTVDPAPLAKLFAKLQDMQTWVDDPKGQKGRDIVDVFQRQLQTEFRENPKRFGVLDSLDRFGDAATRDFGLVEAPKNWMPTFELQRNDAGVLLVAEEAIRKRLAKEELSCHKDTAAFLSVNSRLTGQTLYYAIDEKSGDKQYVPSWTDRIFFYGEDATAETVSHYISHYKCDHSLTVSDHAPVSAVITLTV